MYIAKREKVERELSIHRQSKGGRPNIRDQPRNEDSNAATSREVRAQKDLLPPTGGGCLLHHAWGDG